MTTSRRDFLRFIVAGSVAAGCPVDLSLFAGPAESTPQVDGERYDVCHQVRDGHAFARPSVSNRYDVVIVGGGVSGLSAAYFLRQHNFLLLEKEPHWGGNAYLEEYQGQAFATGSAFDIQGSESDELARELGLKLLPIHSPDPTIVNGKWVDDTWGAGLDELPYSPAVRDSFKKFRSAMLAIDITTNAEQYDSEPFLNYLKGYAPEIKQWWDAYGLSNWGAKPADASALVGIYEVKANAALKTSDTRVTLPGGNGALSRRLVETLQPKFGDHLWADATIIAVEPEKNEVRVTFVQAGKLQAVAAKYVILATPKFITARIVSGLSDDQREAMSSFRYCPYPVINMIFDKPVYDRAYDTWCPGNTFTDFIVADWVTKKQPGYKEKNNILTFYTPISELDRHKLLQVESCRQIALHSLQDFHKLLPEFNAEPVEVHFYRRGHPMFLPTPGTFTRVIPVASQPLDRIAFSNTDSVGPVSDVAGSVHASRRAAEWVEKRMAGASSSAARAIASYGK